MCLIVVIWRGKYAKPRENLGAARDKCAVFRGWIGERWGERGDLGAAERKGSLRLLLRCSLRQQGARLTARACFQRG